MHLLVPILLLKIPCNLSKFSSLQTWDFLTNLKTRLQVFHTLRWNLQTRKSYKLSIVITIKEFKCISVKNDFSDMPRRAHMIYYYIMLIQQWTSCLVKSIRTCFSPSIYPFCVCSRFSPRYIGPTAYRFHTTR